MVSSTVLIETLTGEDLYTRIDHDNGEYTFIKQAEQSTPMVPTDNYLTPPAIMESTQPDEADLTEGTN